MFSNDRHIYQAHVVGSSGFNAAVPHHASAALVIKDCYAASLLIKAAREFLGLGPIKIKETYGVPTGLAMVLVFSFIITAMVRGHRIVRAKLTGRRPKLTRHAYEALAALALTIPRVFGSLSMVAQAARKNNTLDNLNLTDPLTWIFIVYFFGLEVYCWRSVHKTVVAKYYQRKALAAAYPTPALDEKLIDSADIESAKIPSIRTITVELAKPESAHTKTPTTWSQRFMIKLKKSSGPQLPEMNAKTVLLTMRLQVLIKTMIAWSFTLQVTTSVKITAKGQLLNSYESYLPMWLPVVVLNMVMALVWLGNSHKFACQEIDWNKE